MRDTKRFVSRRANPLVEIICPHCGQAFRIALSRLEESVLCLLCNGVVEQPAQHRKPELPERLKIPLKGTIITESGAIELDTLEAESDAYTGGRNAFERENNPAAILAARQTDFTRSPSHRNTAKLRAVRYGAIKISLISLMIVGLVVFVWQMIAYFSRP